jgi:predicted O-linked N-acetylglucosamine transferase (SPINDLY family)
VFAKRLPAAQHLARQRVADLFLDTIPVNALTTASDALWAGLPVLTCVAQAPAGRGGSSLLRAIGLPELVAVSLEEYETVALNLAREPARLAALRTRLERNLKTKPLFDSRRYTRHLEVAFNHMWEIYQRGSEPVSFDVSAISSTP